MQGFLVAPVFLFVWVHQVVKGWLVQCLTKIDCNNFRNAPVQPDWQFLFPPNVCVAGCQDYHIVPLPWQFGRAAKPPPPPPTPHDALFISRIHIHRAVRLLQSAQRKAPGSANGVALFIKRHAPQNPPTALHNEIFFLPPPFDAVLKKRKKEKTERSSAPFYV